MFSEIRIIHVKGHNMKRRNGFVSNSSSSSFVIVGIKLDKKLLEELHEKFNVEHLGDVRFKNKITYLSDDGPGYIGRLICDVSSESSELQESEISLSEFASLDDHLEEIMGKKMKSKIYTGTRMC